MLTVREKRFTDAILRMGCLTSYSYYMKEQILTRYIKYHRPAIVIRNVARQIQDKNNS